jgi:recombination protein RecT
MSTAALKAVATDKKEQNPVAAFRNVLEKQRAQIAAALPKHMNPDRMIRLACTEFAKNPTLQKCDAVSVFGGIIQAAQLGLEIGVLGQAYLVPYRNNKKNCMEAQFIPGYKGLIALARRSGEVTSIETNIVYENDTFKLTLGVDSNLVHEPFLDGERGRARLVYGVAKFKDGGHHLEWMSISDVEKVRARSKASSNGPWVTDYEQMVRKTLIRRMANYLPMSIELSNAIQIDEAAEAGNKATIDGDFVVVTERDDEIDPVTGELTDQREQQQEAMVSYGDLLAQVQKAGSIEILDLVMDSARDLPEEQYVKLQQAAEDRREVILGA